MAEIASKKPLDLRGMPCAFVLAEIERVLADSDSVEVQCDHPTTINDTVPEYARSHGYDLTVKPEIYPLDSQVYRLRIAKRGG